MEATFIESIKTHIANALPDTYVDENWGQLDYYSKHPPVKWPCVLIDIAAAQFTNIGKDNRAVPIQRQEGDVILELRVANLRTTNSNVRAPQMQRTYNNSILELCAEVHRVLHGWSAQDNASAFIRASMQKVRRDDGVQEYALRYTVHFHNV